MIALALTFSFLAVWVLVVPPVRVSLPVPLPVPPSVRRPTPAVRHLLVAVAAGHGTWFLIGGSVGVAAAIAAAVAAKVVLARAESGPARREREAAARDLPHLVDLLAATLHSGADPLDGLGVVCAALPGAAARRLAPVLANAQLGSTQAWRLVLDDDVLAPLGQALARSQRTGASVVDTVERLADELEREAAADCEDRARRVGVAAAVPLGVCLLPAFMLLGIVPTVASLLASITS